MGRESRVGSLFSPRETELVEAFADEEADGVGAGEDIVLAGDELVNSVEKSGFHTEVNRSGASRGAPARFSRTRYCLSHE